MNPPVSNSESTSASLSRLVHAVRAGLRAELHDVLPHPIEGIQIGDVALVSRHRLEGFFSRHLSSLDLPDQVSEQLTESGLARAHQGLVQWAESISISRLLHEHGVRHLVFKGRALTLQTSAEEDGRGGGDVDILIDPHDVPRVYALLPASGYLPAYAVGPRTRAGWAFLTYRNREMPYRSPRSEVDLHWRIATESDLLPPTRVLLDRSVTVGRDGQEIPTLSPTDALAACAVHFYLDYAVSLRRLVDFVRLSQLADPHQLLQLPAGSQQLIADVASLCRELFGEGCISLDGLHTVDHDNVSYIQNLFWNGHGGYSHIRAGGNAHSRLQRNFRHLGRYARKSSLLIRLVARGLVWFPPSSPNQSPIGMIHGFRLQLGRILRGQFDSEM
jgi:hypothetical protein